MLSCEKVPFPPRPMTLTFYRYRLAAIFAMILANAPSPSRADDIVLKDAASMTGAVTWLSSGAPGLALAVVRGDEAGVLGFGARRPGGEGAPRVRASVRM